MSRQTINHNAANNFSTWLTRGDDFKPLVDKENEKIPTGYLCLWPRPHVLFVCSVRVLYAYEHCVQACLFALCPLSACVHAVCLWILSFFLFCCCFYFFIFLFWCPLCVERASTKKSNLSMSSWSQNLWKFFWNSISLIRYLDTCLLMINIASRVIAFQQWRSNCIDKCGTWSPDTKIVQMTSKTWMHKIFNTTLLGGYYFDATNVITCAAATSNLEAHLLTLPPAASQMKKIYLPDVPSNAWPHARRPKNCPCQRQQLQPSGGDHWQSDRKLVRGRRR